jgi:D-alanyl-D-alanine carboxypeptidase
LGLSALAAVLTIGSNAADARRHHHYRHRVHVHLARHGGHLHRHASGEGYSPPSASIVVDGNTGRVLEESNPDALRHPASLTKMMTLYLLFERLQAGKIRLDTPLHVSEHAAEQSPTKLGLKAGQTIAVEDAIKGVVTRSANDAAVVIAENLGGSEEAFARLMTQKARALGMGHTTYVNASGLPDDDQLTSARDQALLGRAIQDRFPRYYRFFSTTSFVFRGQTIRGHNHLLGSVAGVDGIKTGFTRASGFNLVTSLHRDGRFLVGVVLGGRSAFQRDAHMRQLLQSDFQLASTRRTAPVLAESSEPSREVSPVVVARPAVTARPAVVAARAARARPDPTPTASANRRIALGSTAPIRPVLVKTVTYRTVTVRTGALSPLPVLVPTVASPAPQPAIVAQPAADPQMRAARVDPPATVVASAGPLPQVASAPPRTQPAAVPSTAKSDPIKAAAPAKHHVHSGWAIQIGAFGAEDEAKQHLSEARAKLHATLGAADPYTEPVQKGDTTLYRARFAGLSRTTAEAACRQLRRNDFACMALKD